MGILTPTGEKDTAINIGCAAFDKTLGKFTSNIGTMPLNCLIFQNKKVEMNENMDQSTAGKVWQVKVCGIMTPAMDDRAPKRSRKESNNDGRTKMGSLKVRKVLLILNKYEIYRREAGLKQTVDNIINIDENIALK